MKIASECYLLTTEAWLIENPTLTREPEDLRYLFQHLAAGTISPIKQKAGDATEVIRRHVASMSHFSYCWGKKFTAG